MHPWHPPDSSVVPRRRLLAAQDMHLPLLPRAPRSSLARDPCSRSRSFSRIKRKGSNSSSRPRFPLEGLGKMEQPSPRRHQGLWLPPLRGLLHCSNRSHSSNSLARLPPSLYSNCSNPHSPKRSSCSHIYSCHSRCSSPYPSPAPHCLGRSLSNTSSRIRSHSSLGLSSSCRRVVGVGD